LRLGLGTGGDPLTFAAFGRDLESRRERYAKGLQTIADTLRDRPINGTAARLYPPAPSLVDRLWESTLSPESGARIGRNGNGLLLARTAFMSNEPTDQNQLPVAQAYLDAHRHHSRTPRIGLSRAVYPAADRRTAIAHLDSGVADYVTTMIARGFFPAGLSQDAYYARSHIHYGDPQEVVDSLRRDVVLPYATELICQVHGGPHPTGETLAALGGSAGERAPALGWGRAGKGGGGRDIVGAARNQGGRGGGQKHAGFIRPGPGGFFWGGGAPRPAS